MTIEVSLFLAILLGGILILFFAAEWHNNRSLNTDTGNNIKKKQCEICTSFYFIFDKSMYWKCPFCGAINKNNDYGDRDSGR